MAFIKIFEGSFPAQSAMLLKKSAFIKQTTLALKGSDGEKVFYNARNAIQSVERITPDDKKTGIKIVLKDGKIIIAHTDRKTIEDIQLIIAAGPEEDGGMFIEPSDRKKAGNNPPHPMIAKTGRFIAWTLGLCFGIIALASFATQYWYVGIVFLAMAAAIVPPILPKVPLFKNKSSLSEAVSIVLLGIIALIVGGIFAPPNPVARKMALEAAQRREANPAPSSQVKAEKPKKQGKVPTQKDAQIMAATLCEMRVKDGLRAPRTAKFPWVKEVSFDGKTGKLVSYVDAENGFGAVIRTHYVCTIEYVGGKPMDTSSWQLTDVATLD